ncbi:Short-chain dehydrogenase [Devosia lucknowensis]|uniref:Short-chain dehydrogenase n=1 Tax=Devosia lucknowensis TaxID=1096929 RepID=A0A1Y6E7J6_9HYPH|nr:SDR family NAD(P)-dependent oxidoreductase [Devosia lucknowensis]SMQ58549.1 Short-chain dehydrogenase [Devosia lucknowensis]
MSPKTVVITGGTAGIGLAAATAIAARGHRLILIGRDHGRGAEALSRLAPPAEGGHRYLPADLSIRQGVGSVVTELTKSEDAIDVLANNAGTWFQRRDVTVDGVERTMAVNHLAYVGLTLGLKPLLLRAQAARVINTGSFVYRSARYRPDNMQSERRFSTNGSYAATKLYNLMFTRALARRWGDLGITVNAFSPGFVNTGFGRGQGGLLEPYYQLTRRLFARSPEKAAETLVKLALSEAVAHVSGAYFEDGRQRPVRGDAADPILSDAVLDWSLRAVGVDRQRV